MAPPPASYHAGMVPRVEPADHEARYISSRPPAHYAEPCRLQFGDAGDAGGCWRGLGNGPEQAARPTLVMVQPIHQRKGRAVDRAPDPTQRRRHDQVAARGRPETTVSLFMYQASSASLKPVGHTLQVMQDVEAMRFCGDAIHPSEL